MADTTNIPIIFLAFANDRDDTVGYLRNLPDEARRLRDVLESAEQAGLCEVVVRSNSTASDIFKVLQDPRYRNRIAIFHYGGHANGYQLLLESPEGKAAAADAGGLASFLAQQQGLQLVFLNGCSTQQQTQELLDANISAVISTSRAIDDKVATDFAFQFYQGLAGGATIRTAYHEAEASLKTSKGSNTRALYYGEEKDADKLPEVDRWPWNLYLRPGSEKADQWNLPEAVNDPLFGLPPLPQQDLPDSPYRHLSWFTRKHADVFFGRGHQIRELYDRLTAPRSAPIILFYGQSGVGKSSLLDAGLIPRLEQDYEVEYKRREGSLLETLKQVFPDAADTSIETAWLAKEEQTGKPLIVFLDQVEELYTRPGAGRPDVELNQLLEAVKATFGDLNRRPQGKLVFGFRKEWLAELESHLIEYELPRTKVFLERLDRRGIIEVAQGPAQSARLRERFGLSVEDGLAEIIADDLLEDRDSAIAPTLQILLTKMWTQATEENYEHPCFSQELYNRLKRDGILLRDFLDQQIAAFGKEYPEAVKSGLLLDIIALHTTPLGTADQCTVEQLQQQYAHLGAKLSDLLQQCQDLYLLTIPTDTQKESTKATRLAHDTLAPLIRERFDQSDKPGQRARRILDNRSVDWKDDRVGTPLDEADLKMVEKGANGTRGWREDEQRLVDASCVERDSRRTTRRWRRVLSIVAICSIILAAIVAGKFAYDAEQARGRVEDRLAESLLGPLSVEPEALSEAELGTLWKLAETDSDRVRLKFVDSALRSPSSSAQLLNRVDMAMVAAAGIDPNAKDEIVRLIIEKLEEPDLQWPQVACCVHIGHALEEKGDRFTTVSRTALVREINKWKDEHDLRAVGLLVSALSGFDEELVAGVNGDVALLRALVYEVEFKMGSEYPIEHVRGVRDLASKLSPEAVEDAGIIVETILSNLTNSWDDQPRPLHLDAALQALESLAIRAGSDSSLNAFHKVLFLFHNKVDRWPRAIDDTLIRLAQRVPSPQADAACKALAERMWKLNADAHGFTKLDSMAIALSRLAKELDKEGAKAVVADFGYLMSEDPRDDSVSVSLQELRLCANISVWETVQGELSSEQADSLLWELPLLGRSGRWAQRISGRWDQHIGRYVGIVVTRCSWEAWKREVEQLQEPNSWYWYSLHPCLTAEFVTAYDALNPTPMPSDENKALYLITQSWNAATNGPLPRKAERCLSIAQMFANLSGQFTEADECFAKAREFYQQDRETDADFGWSRCCNLLVAKLTEETARQEIADILEELAGEELSQDERYARERTLMFLAEGITNDYVDETVHPMIESLAQRILENIRIKRSFSTSTDRILRNYANLRALHPGEFSDDDAQTYFDAWKHEMTPDAGRYSLELGTESLVLLGDKLSPSLRRDIGRELVQRMPKNQPQFIRAMSVVWKDMSPDDRSAALKAISIGLRQPPHSVGLGKALTNLAAALSPAEALQAFVAVTIGFVQNEEPKTLDEFANCMAVLGKELDVEQLVALLRHPTCVGESRQLVLSQLQEKTNARFDNQMWKAVASFGKLELNSEALRLPPVLIPIAQ